MHPISTLAAARCYVIHYSRPRRDRALVSWIVSIFTRKATQMNLYEVVLVRRLELMVPIAALDYAPNTEYLQLSLRWL